MTPSAPRRWRDPPTAKRGTHLADLNVVAVITAQPGSEAVLAAALTALVGPTRAEAGCLSYALYESGVDATTFVTIESWRSESDLDAHMQSPHVAQALRSAEAALAAAPAFHPLIPVSG